MNSKLLQSLFKTGVLMSTKRSQQNMFKGNLKLHRENHHVRTLLDMNIDVNSCKEINCECYKKPKDTGVVLNFRSCAPIQHRKNIAE